MIDVLQGLLEPEFFPFTLAVGLLLFIGAVELLGFGFSAIDLDVPDAGDAEGGPLDWLGIGRVPILVVLVSFLALFSLTGLSLQRAMIGIVGYPLPILYAVLIALVTAMLLTSMTSRFLARVLPRDETDAMNLDSVIWHLAIITTGTAYAGHPARASVRDSRGTLHYVMVEPADGVSRMYEGDVVRLSARYGEVFHAIALESELRSI